MADEEVCKKRSVNIGIFLSPLYVHKKIRKLKSYYLQDRDSLCMMMCPIFRPMVSQSYLRRPIVQRAQWACKL